MPSSLAAWALAALAVLASTPSLPDVELAADAGMPFERVALTRVPALSDTLGVEVRAPGHDPYPAVLDTTAAGEVAVVVPVHPDVLGGGDVALVFFDGPREVGTVAPFRIRGVPAAPGTLRRSAGLQREIVAAEAARFGLTLDDLRDPTAALPVQLWPAADALGMLETALNPNALPALYDGTAPVLDGRPVDLDVADALAGLLGVESVIEAERDRVRARNRLPEAGRVEPVSGNGPADGGRGPRAPSAGPDGAPDLTKVAIDRGDASLLSDLMMDAYRGGLEAHSVVNKVAGDLNNGVGLLPFGVTQGASALIGATLFAHTELALTRSKLYPSSLHSAQASFSTSTFNEDYTEKGSWSGFTVYASSKTWNVGETGAKAVGEAFYAAKGVRGGVDTWRRHSQRRAAGAARSLDADLDATLQGYKDMRRSNRTKTKLADLGRGLGATVGPFRWGPIDLTGSWSTAEVLAGEVAVDPAFQTYHPTAVGAGVIQVKVVGSLFPPLTNEGDAYVNHDVEAKAIRITLSPSSGTYRPGVEVPVSADVQNADDPSLDWSVSQGAVQQTGETTATVFLPSGEDVVYVTARSTSTTGLRAAAFGPVERTGTAAYRVKENADAEDDDDEVENNVCGFALGDIDTLWYVAWTGDRETARVTYAFESVAVTPVSVRGTVRVGVSIPVEDGWLAMPSNRTTFTCDRSGLDLTGVIERDGPATLIQGRPGVDTVEGEGQLRGVTFPNRPRPGLALPDATARIRFDVDPDLGEETFDYALAEELTKRSYDRTEAVTLVFETEMTNRRVVGRERISVPGLIGEVEAWKMTATGTGRVRMRSEGLIGSFLQDALNNAPATSGSVSFWFHPRYGILRQTQVTDGQASTLELVGVRRR